MGTKKKKSTPKRRPNASINQAAVDNLAALPDILLRINAALGPVIDKLNIRIDESTKKKRKTKPAKCLTLAGMNAILGPYAKLVNPGKRRIKRRPS